MIESIKDFLSDLDEWTLYVQEDDSMPWVTFKQNSPMLNIINQAECLDDGDLENYDEEGLMVFSSSQVEKITDMLTRVGVGKVEYKPINWWHDVLALQGDYLGGI